VTFTDPNLTVRPELAPDGLTPTLIDGPTVATIAGHAYRVEAWRLTDGESAVVVRPLVDAPSAANASERIGAFVDAQWGNDALIIEDWGQAGFMGERFRISSRDGGSSDIDVKELRARGIVLTENLFQEP